MPVASGVPGAGAKVLSSSLSLGGVMALSSANYVMSNDGTT